MTVRTNQRTSTTGDYYERTTDDPAPSVTGMAREWHVLNPGADHWEPRPGDRGRRKYALDEPAPTLAFGNDAARWVWERPATTIVGSFHPEVVAAPGYRKPGDPPRQNTPGSVRISERQAGILQSFPPDYPWQGSRTKRFQQIGNAVPPLLAHHILAHLVRPGNDQAHRV